MKYTPKLIQAKTRRRNTMDSLYFTELMERSENNSQLETGEYLARIEQGICCFPKIVVYTNWAIVRVKAHR
jgi:hypothetical protein